MKKLKPMFSKKKIRSVFLKRNYFFHYEMFTHSKTLHIDIKYLKYKIIKNLRKMRIHSSISLSRQLPFWLYMWFDLQNNNNFSNLVGFLILCPLPPPLAPVHFLPCSVPLGLTLQKHHWNRFVLGLPVEFGQWEIRVKRRKDELFHFLPPLSCLVLVQFSL